MMGFQKLTTDEMKSVRGGKCSSEYGGYYFCCPANADDMRSLIGEYLKENQNKASKYIQFCYEVCGYNKQ